jgi:tetratricopeptide (TPR) repeat protein
VAPEQAKPFLDAVLKYAAERADIKGMLEQQAGELVHHELARGFEALHDDAHAETQWRRAIELAGRSNLEAPIGQFELVRDATAWRRHSLAVGLRRQGKLAEAEQELREVLSAIARIEQEEKNRGSKLVGVGAEELSLSSTLAKVLADEQRPGEAATVLRAALEKTVVRTHDGYGVAVPSGFATLFAKRELTSYQSKSTLARHWEHLGQLYESAGKPEKAAEWRGKLEAQSAVKP